MKAYKPGLVKVGDNLSITYFVPYFIKGKERLILRKFKGVCEQRYSLRSGGGEVIKLKVYFKRNIAWISFNLKSPLLVELNILDI